MDRQTISLLALSLLALSIHLSSVTCQQEDVQTEKRGPWPIVNVDTSNQKARVGVHVPVVFDMDNESDPKTGKSKLDLSVLQGLVTVKRDKDKQGGPLTVTVFGIPVYSGWAPKLNANPVERVHETIEAREKALNGTLENVETDLKRETGNSTAEEVVASLRRTNEKVMSTISDLVTRLNSLSQQARAQRFVKPEAANNITNENSEGKNITSHVTSLADPKIADLAFMKDHSDHNTMPYV